MKTLIDLKVYRFIANVKTVSKIREALGYIVHGMCSAQGTDG